ncbi:MAG: zinc ABC transporter substrate-binding protein [Alphaproteobacteria bacterium]|nr:zinc ABC transporter substrate-binding protein [Alphaproteobacteria bacterium]
MIKKVVFTLSFLLSFFASLEPKANTPTQEKLIVTASFSILGDVIKNIGGDLVTVNVIVGPNQDTHVYEPTPDDNLLIISSDLVVINGLSFETWFERLVSASGYKNPIIVASQGIPFHKMMEPQISNEPVPDPHVWNDVRHVSTWVYNIKKALQEFDPQNASVYEEKATLYLKELQNLDRWIKEQFKGVPEESCKVITAHDAFNYFEKAYGLVFLSPQGLSTTDEPSAHEMASLIKQIKKEKIKTIFVENISSQRLIRQLAAETGAKIGGTLYSDALSTAEEPASTYIKLMESNVKTLAQSLRCFVSPL